MVWPVVHWQCRPQAADEERDALASGKMAVVVEHQELVQESPEVNWPAPKSPVQKEKSPRQNRHGEMSARAETQDHSSDSLVVQLDILRTRT